MNSAKAVALGSIVAWGQFIGTSVSGHEFLTQSLSRVRDLGRDRLKVTSEGVGSLPTSSESATVTIANLAS